MVVAIIIIEFAVIITITHAVSIIGTRLEELVHGAKELVLDLARRLA